MKYSKDYEIHYYHCAPNMTCSIYSMIRFFEDIAIQQSESLGVGVEFYHKEKVGWMLSRWRININRLPRFGEVIKIITNPKAFSGFYANREFVVLDKDACEIITANTLWIFVNLETRRPARISQIMYDKYAPSERDMKTFTKLEEIKTIEKVDYSKQFRVRLSDIDTNGHVNNSQYINWSMETYPVEIHSGHSIKKLTVNYLKETSRDDIVSAKTVIENSGEFICCASEITSGETVVARIESGWI